MFSSQSQFFETSSLRYETHGTCLSLPMSSGSAGVSDGGDPWTDSDVCAGDLILGLHACEANSLATKPSRHSLKK